MRRKAPLRSKEPLRSKTALGRGGGFRVRRKRLSPRSERRLEEMGAYAELRSTVRDRDRGECVARLVWPEIACGGPIDPHHLWPTGNGGPRLEPGNVILCCRGHHDTIHHDQPAEARRRGLLYGEPFVCPCRGPCPRCGRTNPDDDVHHPEDGLAGCVFCPLWHTEWWAGCGPVMSGRCPADAVERLAWDAYDLSILRRNR